MPKPFAPEYSQGRASEPVARALTSAPKSALARPRAQVLHKLFPPFMHGAKMIGQVIYVDPEAYNKALIESLHEKVNQLALMVRTVHLEIEGLKASGGVARGGGGGGGGGAGAQAQARIAEAAADAALSGVFAAKTPGAAAEGGNSAAIKPLHPSLTGAQPGAADSAQAAGAAGQPAAAKSGPQKLTNVIYFFAIYFAFQWLVGRSD